MLVKYLCKVPEDCAPIQIHTKTVSVYDVKRKRPILRSMVVYFLPNWTPYNIHLSRARVVGESDLTVWYVQEISLVSLLFSNSIRHYAVMFVCLLVSRK